MRRNSLFVYYLLRLMIRAHIKETESSLNILIISLSLRRAIFVQPVWGSTSSLTDSFCFYILTKWGSSLGNDIPAWKNMSFVITYLACMRIGATIGLTKFLVASIPWKYNQVTDIKSGGRCRLITIVQFCITWSILSHESPNKLLGVL